MLSTIYKLFLGILLLGIVIAFYIYTVYKKSKMEFTKDYPKEKEEMRAKIQEKFSKFEEKYNPKFLAYCLYELAKKAYITQTEIEQKIFEPYGEVNTMPVINEFGEKFSADEFEIIREELKKYLDKKRCLYDEEKSPESNFRACLYKRAKQKAEEIFPSIFKK